MIIFSDTHFDDKVANAYRWEIFPFLDRVLTSESLHDHTICFLGDLTDRKDRHSSWLTNTIVQNLQSLIDRNFKLIVVRGNHDYIEKQEPFFHFLEAIPGITYVNEPLVYPFMGSKKMVFLPHLHDPRGFKKIRRSFMDADYLFMHQSVLGSLTSSGYKLPKGMRSKFFTNNGKVKVYSGDIHLPQNVRGVEYVGSPYSIKFDDHFQGRILNLNVQTGKESWLFPNLLRRWTVEVASNVAFKKKVKVLGIQPGDEVKVRLTIKDANHDDWVRESSRVKRFCKKVGIRLHTVQLWQHSEKAEVRIRLTTKEKQHLQQNTKSNDSELLHFYSQTLGIPDSKYRVAKNIIDEN
ncbi:metallophosphoesterase [Candidatus Pacearchaeota archaeon]|nr:metallophosphoesterase [Candidatus Pacearchaeota archaeon]